MIGRLLCALGFHNCTPHVDDDRLAMCLRCGARLFTRFPLF